MPALFDWFRNDQLSAREEELNLLLDDMSRDPQEDRDKSWEAERRRYLEELAQNLRMQDRLKKVEKS